MSTSLIDDAFELLQAATELEEEGNSKKSIGNNGDNNDHQQKLIEAGTKYYEATYLMKRYLQRMPPSLSKESEATRALLQSKIQHYESIASNLLMANSKHGDDVSTSRSISLDSIVESHDHDRDDNNNICQVKSSGSTRSLSLETTSSNSQKNILSPQSPRFGNDLKNSQILQKAGQANATLQRALDLDESNNDSSDCKLNEIVINEYIKASQLYLDALQIAEELKENNDASIISSLKVRLEGSLDRIEELKKNKNKERNTNQQNQLPTKLHISDTAHISQTPTALSSQKIPTSSSLPLPTRSKSKLTQTEIDVLKRSSLIASGLFLPWSDSDAYDLVNESNAFNKGIYNQRYTDPDGFLSLSPKQQGRLWKWARPDEILQIRNKQHAQNSSSNITMIKSITPYTIRQQAVQDCSFIASLCICSAYERRFQKRLVTSIIYPKDNNGKPVYNPYGKYIVKLWLNGVERAVIVDDYLPIDKYGNLLCSHTTSLTHGKQKQSPRTTTTLELWVSIIEKAYVKMAAGSYDFPGSNSGVDLYSLTGWIPERIFFPEDPDPSKIRDFETPSDRAWERLYSANSFGDCLITVSMSSDISETIATDVGLVTGHAYAVLGVIKTQNGTKLLRLKNPWAHMGWKGRYSCHDKDSWSDKSFCNEVGYNPEEACNHDDGVFWICWDDVLVYFRHIHLSWNPSLFSYEIKTHALWPRDQGPYDDTFNVGENPQYLLTLSDKAIHKKATIWILLSRHVTKQEQEGSEEHVDDYLTVHIHRNTSKKERIWYPGGKECVLTGAYTNNPHILARYEVSGPKDKYLSLVLSQYKKAHDLGYTLSCYCTNSFQLGQPVKELQHTVELNSKWDTKTAGGPPGTMSFYNNPMWGVKVPENGGNPTYVQLRVSTTKTFAANIMLVRVDNFGDRPRHIPAEPAIDSGPYKHGFVATTTEKIAPGTYTLIVSTFYPQQIGSYHVRINSTMKLQVRKLPE